MPESLKAARERVATEAMDEVIWLDAAESIARSLRSLQKQAILAWEERRRQPDCAGDTAAIDALLDGPAPESPRLPEPPPHHPPRCVVCGGHEPEHALYAHAFVPQSLRCYRAHPHSEPCEPERQAALESRGWNSTGGGDDGR